VGVVVLSGMAMALIGVMVMIMRVVVRPMILWVIVVVVMIVGVVVVGVVRIWAEILRWQKLTALAFRQKRIRRTIA
jgi:hypothetical protein